MLAATLAAALARALYLREFLATPQARLLFADAADYHRWALALSRGEAWPDTVFAHGGVFYVRLMALIYRIAGPSPDAVRVVQAVVGAALAGAVVATAAPLLGQGWSLVAGLVFAVYGPEIHDEAQLDTAVWIGWSLILLALCLRHVREAPSARGRALAMAGAAAATAAAILLRGSYAPLLVLAPLALVFKPRRLGPALGLGALAALLVILGRIAGPPTGLEGIPLYIGNHAQASGLWEAPPRLSSDEQALSDEILAYRVAAERALGRSALEPGEISRYWRGQAVDFWFKHPGSALALTAKKAALYWNRREIPNLYDYQGARVTSPVLSALPVSFAWLGPAALVGLALGWRRRAALAPLYIAVAAAWLAVVPFFVCSRYRLPALPLLAVFAALGLAESVALARRRALTGRAAAALLALWLVAVALVVVPRVAATSGQASYIEAVALSQAGDDLGAVRSYERALAREPDNAMYANNLGACLERLGRAGDAELRYRESMRLDPTLIRPRRNLAGLLLARADFAAAEVLYRSVLTLAPADPVALTGLGYDLASQGRFDEAVSRLDQATRLDPGSVAAWRGLAAARRARGDLDGAREAALALARLAPDDALAREILSAP